MFHVKHSPFLHLPYVSRETYVGDLDGLRSEAMFHVKH